MISVNSQLIGQILCNAGLISFSQVQVALTDLEHSPNLRLGEILAIRGWIEPQTADFFADEWHYLVEQPKKYPLGYYLKKSALLTEEQIDLVLQEQKQIWVKFGSVAVLQGLLKQKTLDFFLDNLFPGSLTQSPSIGKRSSPTANNLEPKIAVDKSTLLADNDDIPWID